MTERQFQSPIVRHKEAECNGKKGILCLMNFPIPKWEADEVAVCKNTLTGALAWLKRKIEKKHLEVLIADPEADPYEKA